MNTNYKWRFFRAGDFDQVTLQSGADLAHLRELDQKLWVALACPTTGMEFDAKTLVLLDTDNDGRIRVPEVIAAVDWTTSLIKNPDDLLKGSPALPLAAINDTTLEGKQILASARQTLINLGKTDAATITLEDTADTAKIFAATNFNGDGIIPVEAADNDFIKGVITDIIACMGIETDRSGKPGIGQVKADTFFTEAKAYSDWWTQSEGNLTILPLGEDTPAAFAAMQAVKIKIDDYFARCRLAAFDARAVPSLNRDEKDYAVIAAKDMTAGSNEVAAFPLAMVDADKPLPLTESLNPAWAAAIATFQATVVKPLLGERTALAESEWQELQGRLAGFEKWSVSKLGVTVEKLGLKRVREILATDAQEKINALIARDKALEPEANAIAHVEKLIRFYRDLYTFTVNFVSFQNFYNRTTPAIFQAGRLFLDQRSCDLCLTVEDPAKHAAMAGLAGAYLVYVDCIRKATGEKLSILAIVSQGDDDNLMVGRNGIFYDRKGRDFDATVTKIISNPISIRQAFWSPYKKLARLIEEQVAKRAAAAEDQVSTNLTAVASTTAGTAPTPAKPAFDPSVIALISLALGSIGAACASVLVYLGKFEAWQLPLIFGGVIMACSGPSMVMAFMQLRRRNLGPILDANGWAVNAKAKINIPFGTSLTDVAKLPSGSAVDIGDRFAQKSVAWPKVLVAAFLIWWIYAFINDKDCRLYRWTDGKYGRVPETVQTEIDKANAQKTVKDMGTNAVSGSAVSSATNAPSK